MNITISPNKLTGTIGAIPSKSQAHRMLICAALADRETEIICPVTSKDIAATVDCLMALGADIASTADGYLVHPIRVLPQSARLHCGESGSTLRFLLPLVAALGVEATFVMEGRLPQRPLSPLWELLQENGCTLARPSDNTLLCCGQLRSGDFAIGGDVSSQFITGLLFALTQLEGQSRIRIRGQLQSRPYVDMTLDALRRFGVHIEELRICGKQTLISPKTVGVEGDWSNAAFFLAAQALGSDVLVKNLDVLSAQGDKAIAQLLPALEEHCCIDCSDIPDLVPILSVVAGAKKGAAFTNIQRLHLKESDRIEATIEMLAALGCHAEATQDTLTVHPGVFHAGTVNSFNDHRIAMATAIAATVATGPVTILNAEAVNKSYPDFWADYRRLGGNYEFLLR